MITQKCLDRLADVYQTIGWDIEFHLGELVENCRKVRIFHNGKLTYTTSIADSDYDFENIKNLVIDVNANIIITKEEMEAGPKDVLETYKMGAL